MKQSKSKKSTASAAASTAKPTPALPDAEYVAQLLAAAPVQAEVEVAMQVEAADESMAEPIGEPSIEPSGAPASVVVAGVLNLSAQCLLRDAAECRLQLLNCLDSDNAVIDVAAVERIDTAYMQVLLTFVRSRKAALAAVSWLNVNAVFLEAVDMLGLRSALGLPAQLVPSGT